MTVFLHQTSVVGRNCEFSASAYIGPYCCLGGHGFQHPDWNPDDFNTPPTRMTRIGDGARILGLSIVCCGAELGDRFRCDYQCFVGERSFLGSDVTLEYGGRVYDDCTIGNHTTIGGFVCNGSVIGRHCNVQGSLVHKRTSTAEAAPTIGDYCLIGEGSVIVGSVMVASGTVLAAGAVLTTDTEAGHLYVGTPARRVKQITWV